MIAASASPLVGRTREREAIATALAAMRTRPGGLLAIEGEPGIGKSRLVGYLAERAVAGGCTVLAAAASEFETDLPYAVVTEALDPHLAAAGERRLSRLGIADPGALATVAPALAVLGGDAAADGHRTHRALRDLLERLAATAPVVVCLDDVHWADPATVGLLAALARRPPAGPVLLALAAREGQWPSPLGDALAAATLLAPRPLTMAEAEALVGERAHALYREAGGNPFYLEQLARVRAPGLGVAGDGSVPPAVAGALAAELATLGAPAGRLLDAAAVAGDPFEPALAAAIAELPDDAALTALDELLRRTLVRPAGAARRFAFRHPLVRHAVYHAAPGGWRLGAHARAAAALERRGAGPVQRAHHVEHAAVPGDLDAVELLSAAGAELRSLAPAAAAGFHAAALRLLPDGPQHLQRRARLQASLADAQAAAGDPLAARDTLVQALRTAPPDRRLALTVALANQEWLLGGHEDARRPLQVALADQPARPSPDRIRLRLALALTALLGGDLADAAAQASDARDDARSQEEPIFEVAALACGAVATAAQAAGSAQAAARVAEAAAAMDRLTPPQLATRLPGLWMLARAQRALGDFAAAVAHVERGRAIARETGRELVLLMLLLEAVPSLVELGRIPEAVAAAEEGLERARLTANPRLMLWAHSAGASARLAAGDVEAALRSAGQAARLDARPDFHAAGQPGWCLGTALLAAGNPGRAVPELLGGLGGEGLGAVVPADRPAAAADLVLAQIAGGDLAAAGRALDHGLAAATPARTGWAQAVMGVARAELLLATGHAGAAARVAASAGAAAGTAPLTAARARLVEGRALAAAEDRAAAVAALTTARSAFEAFGAGRARDAAVRELRRLGHRSPPATGRRQRGGSALTAREQEIAELVAAGRTNREISDQLVLSTRTVDAHLRNVFAKLGVRSRVELTRELHGR